MLVGCGSKNDGPDTGAETLVEFDSDGDSDADFDGGADADGGAGADADGDADGSPVEPLYGFIGSPCMDDEDCDYEGGVCLTEGFEDGMCSAPCDLYCPDMDGYPTTFCVDASELPAGGSVLGGGACVSRCDFGAYTTSACRYNYGCNVESRHTEPDTQTYACMPGTSTDLSECHLELAARGVGFEPSLQAVQHPEGHPELDCEIDEPVWVTSPVLGVEMLYYDGTETPRTLASCEMAHALADTVEDVAPEGVSAILHIGTYNCRVIGGTSRLSRHSYADAIDIYGFEFEDGRVWTLVDDWEHGTETPSTEAGSFLYSAAQRWYDDWIWNIILTPNYNADHDNHFHVDLTPDSHTVGATSNRYFGPAPYAD
jgi:hypothetical protein